MVNWPLRCREGNGNLPGERLAAVRLFLFVACFLADNSLPVTPSFSCPKRKRKGPAVPMRRPPAGARSFCIVLRTIQKTTRSVDSEISRPRTAANGWERNLALLRCGHLTTAYSPAWGPVNKENDLIPFPGRCCFPGKSLTLPQGFLNPYLAQAPQGLSRPS